MPTIKTSKLSSRPIRGGSNQDLWRMYSPVCLLCMHSIQQSANSRWAEFQHSVVDNMIWVVVKMTSSVCKHIATHNSCNFPGFKCKFSCSKTTDYLKCIYFLREDMKIQSDAWDLHFIRYSGDMFKINFMKLCQKSCRSVDFWRTYSKNIKGRFYWNNVVPGVVLAFPFWGTWEDNWGGGLTFRWGTSHHTHKVVFMIP